MELHCITEEVIHK